MKTLVQRIAIVDHGMGNLHSVKKKYDRIGAGSVVISAPGGLKQADKIVLPGVGHFGKAMETLVERNDVLHRSIAGNCVVYRQPLAAEEPAPLGQEL